MIRLLLGLACLWIPTRAQNPNGIIFTNSPASPSPTAPVTSTVPLIVNTGSTVAAQTCVCVIAGTCPTGIIDLRIVNNPPTQSPCPAGYSVCCTAPGTIPGTTPTPVDTTCGIRKITPSPQPLIGQASFGAYPWHAAILDRQLALVGSGVLLDATHIATVAHKVAAYVNNPAALLVRLGEWDARTNSEPYQPVTVNVAKITLYPSFNPVTLENDIAIVRLNGLVPIASYPNVNTACKPATPPVAGTRCYVSGWGKNVFGPAGSYQSILKEVDVPILDINDCEYRLRQTRLGAAYVLSRTSFLCAGGEAGKDACTGDGGSPLVCQKNTGQWQVVGLVSWGIGCAQANIPGMYTNIFNFLGWINQVLVTA